MVQIKCLSNGLYSLKTSHIPFGMGFQPPPYGGFPFEQHFSYTGSSLRNEFLEPVRVVPAPLNRANVCDFLRWNCLFWCGANLCMGSWTMAYDAIHAIHSTIHYHAMQCSAMKYFAIPCNRFDYNTIPCNPKQCNETPSNTMQLNLIQYNTLKYPVISCNDIEYNKIPCNTILSL